MAIVDEVGVAEGIGRHVDIDVAQLLRRARQYGVQLLLHRPEVAVAHQRQPAVAAVARKLRTIEELADPEGDDAALAVDGRYLANVALVESIERRVVTRYRIAAVGIDEIADGVDMGADEAHRQGEQRRDRDERAADPTYFQRIDLARQMKIGIGRIEMGDMRVAQVVPADIVDGAARRLAELGLIERRLDQVFDRRVARHAVIDDEEAALAVTLLERGGEPVAPGVAFARGDIVGRRAAEGRHDVARRQFARHGIATARAFRAVADRKAGGAGEAQRGDRNGLQQRMPVEALRL